MTVNNRGQIWEGDRRYFKHRGEDWFDVDPETSPLFDPNNYVAGTVKGVLVVPGRERGFLLQLTDPYGEVNRPFYHPDDIRELLERNGVSRPEELKGIQMNVYLERGSKRIIGLGL